MPGTGTPRRSNPPARKKAIVGKPRIEANRNRRLSFVFLASSLVMWGLPSDLMAAHSLFISSSMIAESISAL
jgi:hypothetical protein